MVGTAIVDNSLLCGVQRHLPPRRCSKALTSKKTTTLGGCRCRRCGGGVGGREEQREQGLEKTKSEMNQVPIVPIFFVPIWWQKLLLLVCGWGDCCSCGTQEAGNAICLVVVMLVKNTNMLMMCWKDDENTNDWSWLRSGGDPKHLLDFPNKDSHRDVANKTSVLNLMVRMVIVRKSFT